MKITILLITLAICLISLNGVMAMVNYCGDGICDRSSDTYNESNPLNSFFCPLDCGDSTITSGWCEDTFSLRTGDCPTCPTCGSSPCDISRISDSSLRNWCTSSGYSTIPGGACSGSSGSGPDLTNKYYWLIFLVIGFIIGYYYKKKGGKLLK